jgi:hypothetical protein
MVQCSRDHRSTKQDDLRGWHFVFAAFFVFILLSGCGESHLKKVPIEYSRVFSTSADSFVMTKELPDVTRRLTNWLNTCWLQAGLKELEYDYFATFDKPTSLSVEYMTYASIEERFFRVVYGATLNGADLEAGGEMNEVRRLSMDFGVVTESDWNQKQIDWVSLRPKLRLLAVDYRELYRSVQRRSGDTGPIIKNAQMDFNKIILAEGLLVPQEVMIDHAAKKPQEFANGFSNENPSEYILYLDRAKHDSDLTKSEFGTTQDMFLTSYQNIAKTIIHEIDHARSVQVSIYWADSLIDEKKGVWTVKAGRMPESAVGHVVNITGYHVDDRGQLDRIKIENTWGSDYGRNGFVAADWQQFSHIFEAASIQKGYVVANDLSLPGIPIRE